MQWAVSHLAEWCDIMRPAFEKARQELTLDAMVQKTQKIYTAIAV
jgi:hypothetical protein